jgi:hypothetical protein
MCERKIIFYFVFPMVWDDFSFDFAKLEKICEKGTCEIFRKVIFQKLSKCLGKLFVCEK